LQKHPFADRENRTEKLKRDRETERQRERERERERGGAERSERFNLKYRRNARAEIRERQEWIFLPDFPPIFAEEKRKLAG